MKNLTEGEYGAPINRGKSLANSHEVQPPVPVVTIYVHKLNTEQ